MNRLTTGLVSRWFALTAGERRALTLVLVIAAIGTALRLWHLQREPAPVPVSEGETQRSD